MALPRGPVIASAPTVTYAVSLPAATVLTALLPMAWIIRQTVKRRRRQHLIATNCCTECGYDLRSSPDCCPECGRTVAGTV